MTVVYCRDAGFDRDAVVRGDDVEESLAQVRPHAAAVHGVAVDGAMRAAPTTLVSGEDARR